jgi:hypothetical protein
VLSKWLHAFRIAFKEIKGMLSTESCSSELLNVKVEQLH